MHDCMRQIGPEDVLGVIRETVAAFSINKEPRDDDR